MAGYCMRPMSLARVGIALLATAQNLTPSRRFRAPTSYRAAIWSHLRAWLGIRALAWAALTLPGVAVVLSPQACPEWTCPAQRISCRSTGRPPLARSVLFDVGAGGPNDDEWRQCREKAKAKGIDHANTSEGSAKLKHLSLACKAMHYRGGASVPSWIDRYARRCINFDRIFAWEARLFDGPAWWATLPPHVRMRTSFYNVRVDAEQETPAATNAPPRAANGMNVLSWLSHTVAPDDFVVLKLDIDHSPTELSIMHALAEDPRLLALVDELWFEYHFQFDQGVEFGWKKTHFNRTVDDALRLMHTLRARGVRAHFWV